MSVLLIILVYGVPLSLVLSALLLTMIRANPRLMLQDYPKDIQAAVPPKTSAEKHQTRFWGIILLLLVLIFCTFTPAFAVLPGTEGMAGYKNYAMHFRGFLIGTLFSAGVGVVTFV